MPTVSPARAWIDQTPPRTFIRVENVPTSRRAAETALARLASDADGPILRVRQGLYWKKPPRSRFGTPRPNPVDVAMTIAGPGAGPSGWLATNALGLSTQVPATSTIAVVGRAPTPIPRVRFAARSNRARTHLQPLDIAALETLRDYPTYCEKTWADVIARLRQLDADSAIDLQAISTVAATEHHTGVRDRLADVLA